MAHWTEAQMWQNTKTAETKTAGALIAQYDRYLRINRVSLCCATFDVRMDDGSVWRRIPETR
jgi:hypothetical protein